MRGEREQNAEITRQNIVDSVPQTGFFGHPKGLLTLFFTEFWERFSYYGMRALLLYYIYDTTINGGLGFTQATAAAIMSVYGSLVYMSSIIGGWLADRVFGKAKSLFYGGVLIMLGHIALAFPGGANTLFLSMGLIIIGTGMLKPNVSSTVGELYAESDNRRDAGFSIYYMGINMGAFIAPLIVGTVGQKVNYHLGFSLAAIGMLAGLLVFLFTRKKMLGLAGVNVPNPLTAEERGRVLTRLGIGAAAIAAIVAVAIWQKWLTIHSFTVTISVLGVLIPIAYFTVMHTSSKTTEIERSRLRAYIPLFIAAVMFWSIQEQGSTILGIYADTRTQLDFAGIHIEPSWFQSANPLFIIVLAPVFAWLWTSLGDRQPSVPVKFSLGLLFAGLSFLVILLPAQLGGGGLVNPLWLVLSYFVVVLGELCLSPVGLSTTTKLAPAAFSAQAMSLWFLAPAAAQAINALIVQLYSEDNEMMYFGTIGGLSIALGVALFLIAPVIRKAMRGIH
ncbi:peptide MFS transporter [Saccharibacillus sp. CPCC 101409]|uniref:peptide MFS transporter n=1 Tax=Saccharibacillus sp. CPCC 101409 TaxID=3058041 RepID=UPI002672B5D8|nr:peptide MFS transporter [Saccharibacillus sp. CPCC 101409]MDO3409951.1 peptide MFS transporter [Saccharibacillus sp. CPCC 101409]